MPVVRDPSKARPAFFETMAEAAKEGKKALGRLLANRSPDTATPSRLLTETRFQRAMKDKKSPAHRGAFPS